jgi:hypothetical protein
VRRPKADPYLSSAEAQDLAREALDEVANAADVGEYLGLTMEGERVATLRFACELPGYVGWNWVVTMARIPRARHATVAETELLPGEGALLAPPFVPWADRLQPGDIRPGDILPHIMDDPRLELGYAATGEEDVDQLATWELGLGRSRVLSPEGRAQAAQRWYEGAHGPSAPEAIRAPASCSTCGFVTPLAGSLRTVFGVCANQWSPRDGSVVAYDHGCGAHSETDVARTGTQWPANSPMVDDSSIVPLSLDRSEEPAQAGEPGPL